jgi:hypothetical protein
MTYPRPLVAILGVGSVEADRNAKGLILRLLGDEPDGLAGTEVCLMPGAAIRHLMEIGIPADGLERVEHSGRVHIQYTPVLTVESCSVSSLFQK